MMVRDMMYHSRICPFYDKQQLEQTTTNNNWNFCCHGNGISSGILSNYPSINLHPIIFKTDANLSASTLAVMSCFFKTCHVVRNDRL